MTEASSKRWVSTELDEDTHRTLLKVATELGVHPTKLIEKYITDGLTNEALTMDLFAPPELRVYAALQEVRKRSRIRSQLGQIAFEHQNNPSEESADILQNVCDISGVTVEDVVSHDLSSVPLIQDNGNGVSSCVRWLQKYCIPNREFPVPVVLEQGKSFGFSEAVIRSAKAQLGIISKRASKTWVWVKVIQLPPEPTIIVPEAEYLQ
jgi:antitoxin component of RelBE/YafQ-DinJ toxin-antitoxin module